jgi:hypothetical protein
MITDSTEQWFSQDSVQPNYTITGTVDDVVTDAMDWDSIPTFSPSFLSDAHRTFFDTDEFYQFNATVAKSIPQDYTIDGEDYQFLKTGSALEQAVFSVDNTPFVIEHPPIGRVTQTSEIKGVFHDSYYDAVTKSIHSTVSIPANNTNALSYIEDNSDVSIGFYNSLNESDRPAIDAEQRDIYIDHIASVPAGRCSGEDGCGIRK